jgi:hypothetical protein
MSVTVTAPATFTTTVTSNAAAATIATDSTTGTAKFNTDNFAISGAGDVTIKDAGVLLTAEVTGTLPIANGGTGATAAAMVGIITAADASAARTVLELVPGTSANQIVQMTSEGKLPAVDGSDLTNLAASPTYGISNTNAVKVDSASVADDEYARFTASGLESRSTAEVLSDIGAAAASHNQTLSTITDAGGAASLDVGTTAGTVAAGDDDRLSDARTPVAHSTDLLTTGTLPVARGGTGVTSLAMVSIPAAADAAAARTVLELGTAAVLAVGISNTNVLQANAVVADNDFLRIDGTTVEGRSAAEVLSDIGAQAADADLTAIAGLTSAADKGIQFTGSGTAGVYDLTAAGKALLDDADAAAQRTTLGVTNVGSYTGQIETVADKTYTLDPGAATDRTITGFYIKSASGTVTATLKNGADTVKAASVTDATADQTGLANTSVSANGVLTLVTSSNSSALDVIFAVEYTE